MRRNILQCGGNFRFVWAMLREVLRRPDPCHGKTQFQIRCNHRAGRSGFNFSQRGKQSSISEWKIALRFPAEKCDGATEIPDRA